MRGNQKKGEFSKTHILLRAANNPPHPPQRKRFQCDTFSWTTLNRMDNLLDPVMLLPAGLLKRNTLSFSTNLSKAIHR